MGDFLRTRQGGRQRLAAFANTTRKRKGIKIVDPFLKETLKKKYPDEQVYVIPYACGANYPDRFSFRPMDDLLRFQRTNGKFVMRHDAEYNRALFQLIPYVLVLSSKGDKAYVARRIGGDKRLLGKWSFFGGHINPCDFTDKCSVIEAAAERELQEEICYTPLKDSKLKLCGSIQDKQSETAEHLGFVYTIKVVRAKIKETDNLEGKWMTLNEMVNHYADFEGWAKYVIDYLFEQNKGFAALVGGDAAL